MVGADTEMGRHRSHGPPPAQEVLAPMHAQSKDRGIDVRHSRSCRSRNGGRCSCTPTYQAHVWSRRDGKRICKTFITKSEAKLWRSEALVALDKGAMRAPTPETVREAAASWLEGARAGTIRNRSGDPYKPSAIRSYERAIRLRVLPALGVRPERVV
jgi:hypothetical protein